MPVVFLKIAHSYINHCCIVGRKCDFAWFKVLTVVLLRKQYSMLFTLPSRQNWQQRLDQNIFVSIKDTSIDLHTLLTGQWHVTCSIDLSRRFPRLNIANRISLERLSFLTLTSILNRFEIRFQFHKALFTCNKSGTKNSIMFIRHLLHHITTYASNC